MNVTHVNVVLFFMPRCHACVNHAHLSITYVHVILFFMQRCHEPSRHLPMHIYIDQICMRSHVGTSLKLPRHVHSSLVHYSAAMSTSRSSTVDTCGSLLDALENGELSATSDNEAGMPRSHGAGSSSQVDPHASPSKDVDTLMFCDFDCGPAVPRKDLINKGNSRSHCLVCRPCYYAMHAIVRSWSKTPESKAMFDEVRQNDKPRWQALVRQCRVRSSADEIGMPDIRSRKKKLLESTQSMIQSFGIRDTTDIMWLTRSRYVAHQIYVEGIHGKNLEEKEAAALAKWQRDFANPDIVRRGTGTDTQLGVLGVPRTEGFRVRECRREVTCTDTLVGANMMGTALNDLAEHGTTAQALTGKAMGDFGVAFLHGAASTCSDTLPPSLPARVACAPPSSVVCDASALEPPTGFSGTREGVSNLVTKKRALTRMGSDTTKRAKGGVTGKLLDMRMDALALIKRTLQRHTTARSNMAARWESLRKAGHVNADTTPPQIPALIKLFTDTIAFLKTDAKKDVTSWALSTAPARSDELTGIIGKLDTISTSIAEHVTAVEERVKRQRKAEVSDMRRQQCERTRLLAPWRSVPVEARVPMSLLRYMLDRGLLVEGYGHVLPGSMVKVYSTLDGPLIDTRPWMLDFSSDGPGRELARLRTAIGEKRIDDGIVRAEQHLGKDLNRISTDTRFAPMGGGHDFLEDLAWVPSEWRAKSYTPEALRSLGAPWLLSDDIAAARKDPEQWPLPGFAHFLSVVRGSMVTCLILASTLLERGCSIRGCMTFLDQLPWKEFESFIVTHALLAELLPGRALWVPYGWRCILLTRSQMDVSHALHIPYVSARMLHASAMKDAIVEFAKEATHEWGAIMACEPCLSMAKEALAWLDDMGTMDTSELQVQPSSDTPRAIEDAHD